MMHTIKNGANIKRSPIPPKFSCKNYPLPKNKSILNLVTKKFLHHLQLGQIKGPYNLHSLPTFAYRIHTSPIAIKLKASGKPMILIDESAPILDSINSHINQQDKRVTYSSLLDLCLLIKRVGLKGWLWVIDAVDAYYRIPIQAKFHHLFGIIWLNKLLIFKCLSFGLATAPSIYNRFADQMLWACTYHRADIFKHKNTNLFNILHYLDDFYGGSHSKSTAFEQMSYLKRLFVFLNIPTNDKKCIGPSQSIVILGWLCSTYPKLQISLSEKKCIKYSNFASSILKSNVINLFQAEKIVGYIRHTCQIYILGNKFVRGIEAIKQALIKTINDPNKKFHKYSYFNLSPEAIFDLHMWLNFWNVYKFKFIDINHIIKPPTRNSLNVFTDASTSFGAGGIDENGNFLYHLPWSLLKIPTKHKFNTEFQNNFKDHIIYLELFALVLMTYLYAKSFSNMHVIFWCDNVTTVKAVNKGSIDFKAHLYYPKANLIKLLAILALKYNFTFECNRISGDVNTQADILSRKNNNLRNQLYNYYNKKSNIPVSIASNIILSTCFNHFCNPFSV